MPKILTKAKRSSALECVTYMTGVPFVTFLKCLPGRITFAFRDRPDYEYAREYMSLTRLPGILSSVRHEALTGTHVRTWVINEHASIVLSATLDEDGEKPPVYTITLVDSEMMDA